MNVLYTLVSIGSAVVVVAVPYPDRATRISHKGHAIKYLKKKKIQKKKYNAIAIKVTIKVSQGSTIL